MTTLDPDVEPDAVSTSPVPSDSTEGLVHELPHALVDAPADRAGTSPAGITAMVTATMAR
jgi:hypothetical protein